MICARGIVSTSLFVYDRASYELEFLKHPATPAIAALVATVIACAAAPREHHWRKKF